MAQTPDAGRDAIDADLHAALVARADECWARLDDLVSELYAVHAFAEEFILERVRLTIAHEYESRF